MLMINGSLKQERKTPSFTLQIQTASHFFASLQFTAKIFSNPFMIMRLTELKICWDDTQSVV